MSPGKRSDPFSPIRISHVQRHLSLPDWQPVALEVMEIGAAADSLPSVMVNVMDLLQRQLGFDSAALSPLSENWAVTWNKPDHYHKLWQQRSAVYLEEVSGLVRAAFGSAGVAQDVEVLPLRVRERAAFYDEYIRPLGGGTFACVGLVAPNEQFGLAFTRHGRARFREAELEWLRRLRPALALAVRGLTTTPPALAGLTAREREFAEYVTKGLSNGEIAALCECSRNTVRNRLAVIFRKLDVTTRAELAALVASSP